jgi:hypothetical protein
MTFSLSGVPVLSNDHFLVEIPPSLLDEFKSPSPSLSINSPSSSSDAILLTPSGNFSIKSVANSNTLLLIKPSSSNSQDDAKLDAFTRVGETIEFIKDGREVGAVRKWLGDVFKGEEWDEDSIRRKQVGRIKMGVLEGECQCGRDELERELRMMRVVEIDGE